jgi:serpin B
MIVLLPQKGIKLAKVEQALTLENFNRWRSSMHQQEVRVSLPKFKTTQRFILNDPLQALGLKDAFDEMNADFSGMTGNKKLYISKVIHKAFVDVNEEGTEAAAATGVTMHTLAMRIQPVFQADHPFVFAIVDKQSGSILFLGRIMNPKQE